MTETNQTSPNISRLTSWVITTFGFIGLLASFAYSVEEFLALKYPAKQLICDINPFVGCGPAIDSWQGHILLGIPNGFFGIAAFSVVATLGVLLVAGVGFPRWVWQGLQAGVVAGTVLVVWFYLQSVFVLNHLCPFCMVTWGSVLPIAWYITIHNIQSGHVRLAAGLHRRVGNFAVKHHATLISALFGLLITIVIWRFWDYFGRGL